MRHITTPAASAPAARAALACALAAALAAVAPSQAFAGNGSGASGGHGNSSSSGNGNGAGGGVSNVVTLPACDTGDLSVGGSVCSGFYAGNLLSDSPSDLAAQTAGLGLIGLSDWNGQIAEPQLNLTSSTVDFQTALNGVTWIGIHFGAGVGSPSPNSPGGVTAFYRFDAGTNLNAFTLPFTSASAARLYATGPAPVVVIEPPPPPGPGDLNASGGAGGDLVDNLHNAVPEPATWALMILGFGAAGAVLRRRRALAF